MTFNGWFQILLFFAVILGYDHVHRAFGSVDQFVGFVPENFSETRIYISKPFFFAYINSHN